MVVNLASTGSNARCYIVNGGGQNVPDWLTTKTRDKNNRKRRNKGDLEGQGIRLIQDFDFPEASNKIKTTKDGQYCLVTGTYKPRLKIYDLLELGLKSERVTDAENVDFVCLSDDWTKTLHLQTDRSVSVHTAASVFYSTRIPTHGRALAYHFPTCDALVGAAGNQVYRLNLDQGRFLNSLDCDASVTGVNALDLNPAHGLLACGTENADSPGTVEFWDLRARKRAGILHLPASQLQGATSFSGESFENFLSVSALSSRVDGLNIAVGTSTGHTLLYDLRSTSPYTIKDQGYGLPIKKIEWCYSSGSTESNEAGGLVATADSKVVKVWGAQTGTNLISVNPPHNVNDMHIYPGSGLMMLANEASPVTAYYIPQLGEAPKWSRFLDNMTEEMEGQDSVETLYEDYKFVDRAELRQLGMEHLVGTSTLKPYMHGFFVDLRLYTKARAIANPFAYAEYRDRLVREKLDKDRESRIRVSKTALAQSKRAQEASEAVKKAQVNKDLAEKIRLREEKEEKTKDRKAAKRAAALSGGVEAAAEDGEEDAPPVQAKKASAPSVLTDSRFGALFQDPEFQVDQDSLEFAMLNPSTVAQQSARPKDRQLIGAVEDDLEDEDLEQGSDAEEEEEDDDDDNSSDEGDLGQYDPRIKSGRTAPGEVDPRTGKRRAPNQVRERQAQREVWAQSKAAARERAANPARRPQLVVENGNGQLVSSAETAHQTFGQRAHKASNGTGSSKTTGRSGRAVPRGSATASGDTVRSTAGGGMEMSFVPQTTAAQDYADERDLQERKKQRMDKQARENIRKGTFGSGLEKGSAAADSARAQLELEEDQRSGRKKFRRGIRSASKNKTRDL